MRDLRVARVASGSISIKRTSSCSEELVPVMAMVICLDCVSCSA